MVIAWAPSARELEEMPLAVAAARVGKDPVDLALELALANDLQARFRMAVMNFDEKEVAELITDPNTIIALSDAGAHASQLCDACYSTHLLGHWVRDRKVFTLEEAVHNLTQRPAEMFGITDRGVLAEGRPADVVVFDPKTVRSGAAQARVRHAGRRRPAGVRGERHRSRRRQRKAHSPEQQGHRRGQRQAARSSATTWPRGLGRTKNSIREKIMIHVIAIITAKPGKRDEILKNFKANVPAVHAEKGCIEYGATVDVDGGPFAKFGPDTFVVVEKWETMDDLKAHGASEHA